MKKILVALGIFMLVVMPASDAFAKGGGGRGGGGGARSSVSRSSASKPASKPTEVKTQTVKPQPVIKESTKPVVSSSGKKMSGKGTVVDDNYKPKFKSGYVPPNGATVYYPQRDFMDYLPWIFLFTQDSHREVVVQTTGENGEVKEETQQEEGIDTMYVVNWVVSILLLFGLVYLIMKLISKK